MKKLLLILVALLSFSCAEELDIEAIRAEMNYPLNGTTWSCGNHKIQFRGKKKCYVVDEELYYEATESLVNIYKNKSKGLKLYHGKYDKEDGEMRLMSVYWTGVREYRKR